MELKVFVVRVWGTDRTGEHYDEVVDRVFMTEDQACEHLMSMKRTWMKENGCPNPFMLTDKFNEFVLYKHNDESDEYAGQVFEVPLIGMNTINDKRMFEVADVLFSQPFDSARYAIYKELQMLDTDVIKISDKQMVMLVRQCCEVYEDYEHATPTGVGCAIFNHLLNVSENDDSFNLDDFINDLSKIKKAYESSDWR